MRSTDTIALSAYTYDYTQRIKIMLPHITEAFAKVGSNKVEREREREEKERERESKVRGTGRGSRTSLCQI